MRYLARTRKEELLRLCARIGFNPPARPAASTPAMPPSAFPSDGRLPWTPTARSGPMP
ncbi:hypothetical protein RC1_1462 [Rhodospirillum centenum SW]|uniref:Uncharacterized protein n=1 Tax=Rhodospirillum centenum (strain ATCC 51521 / SW) TaxID=414684 RepID=B6IMW9_RHOCS|nr:hypothetical protein RC1_1462 [Rhodospirillum centenum SW]